MADWDVSWEPKSSIIFGPTFETDVSTFRSGKKQYRKRLASSRYVFQLPFNGVSELSILDAIRTFFIARFGQFESFTFPNFGQRIKGTSLTIADADPDTIADSGSEILTRGFVTGGKVTIAGSGAGNDGVYDIHASTAVTSGLITLAAAESLAAESGNANLIIYATYDVRFSDDMDLTDMVTVDKARHRTIELVEDY
jgi:hypothetical protein